MAGRRGGRASAGRSRSRRDDYDDDYDDAPRGRARGRSAAAQGPNMPLIIGSVVGLVVLLVVGYMVMTSVEESRMREDKARVEKMRREKEEREAKIMAAEEAARKAAEEKLAEQGPWKKALEKILAPLKRWMNKENAVKRIIGTFGFENDRAEFNFKIRDKWSTVPSEERSDTVNALCQKVEELLAAGIEHAAKEGYPMADDKKVLIIHFWDPPTDPESKEMGREVATYRNGSVSFK